MGNIIAWAAGFVAGWYLIGLTGINKMVLKAGLSLGSGGKLAFQSQVFDFASESDRFVRWQNYQDALRRL